MPFIVAARPEDLDQGPGAAIANAGRRLQDLSVQFSELKGRRDREREAARLADERLKIEEQRAAIALQREQRMAGLQEQKATQDQASLEATQQGFQELGDKSQREAGEQAFQMALGSPEGVLGPYGLLKAGVSGVAARMEAQQRMQGYQALASKMDPTTGRAYLAKKTLEEKQKVMADGFALEKQHIESAARGEKISPEMAKALNGALQVEMKSGRPPGEVTKRLAQDAALQAKLRTRETAWAEADKKAAELLTAARTLASTASGGIDAKTGENMQAAMSEALAKAEAEWEKTRDNAYRAGTDPKQALGALHKIVMGAKAKEDPEGFAQERMGVQMEQGVMARHARGELMPENQKDKGKAAQAQAQSQQAPKGGLKQKRTDQQRLEGVVLQGAQKALRAGSREDRVKATEELLDRIADDLGLDPTDERVLSRLQEVLAQVHAAPVR